MQQTARSRFQTLGLILALGLGGAAESAYAGPVAAVKASPDGIRWVPEKSNQELTLTVVGPRTRIRRTSAAGKDVSLSVRDRKAGPLPDGSYRWELRAAPELDAATRKKMAEARRARDQGREVDLGALGIDSGADLSQSGSFSIRGGKIVNPTQKEKFAGRDPEREGSIEVEGDLSVEGRKMFVAEAPDSPGSIAYVALEGPEAGTYYRGTAKTVGGEAVIELPSHFSKVTEAEGLTVQLTPLGGWSRLYVEEMTPERVVVRDAEARDGLAFNFLVQGVRRGFADHRVERPADADLE